MPNIPVSDPLKREAAGGVASRSQAPEKQREGATDADKLKGQPISTVAPTDGQALTWRGTEYVPETPAVTPASTPSGVTEHAIFGTEHTGDFELTLNGGLSITIEAGIYRVGTIVYHAAAPVSKTLTAGTTNFVFLTATGSVTVNTTGPSAGSIPLWQIGMLGSAVSTVTDKRTPFATISSAPVHNDTHVAGGTDAFTTADLLDAIARTQVRKNSAGSVFTRRQLNFIEGANVTLTVADDSGNEEVDVTIAASGGGGAPHAMLDGGAAHTDSETDAVSVGSFIYGNATPKWDEFPIVIPASGLRNVVAVDNGDVVPSYKTVLDTTNPANVAAAAAPGTSLVFARRDHVHAIATTLLFSERIHTFTPDAAPGADIVSGNQQDFSLSSPNGETAVELTGMCETAAGTAYTVTVEYGDTGDLDTVSVWTVIATLAMTTGKTVTTTSMTNATIPANKVLRFNVTTITGTAPRDSKAFLRSKVPLTT